MWSFDFGWVSPYGYLCFVFDCCKFVIFLCFYGVWATGFAKFDSMLWPWNLEVVSNLVQFFPKGFMWFLFEGVKLLNCLFFYRGLASWITWIYNHEVIWLSFNKMGVHGIKIWKFNVRIRSLSDKACDCILTFTLYS